MLIRNNDDLTLDELELAWLYGSKVKKYDDEGNEIKSPIGATIREAKILQELKTPTKKAIKKKCDMQKRIIDRVCNMVEPWFCTFTFSNETMQKDIKRLIKRFFKKVNINDWVLISDYGEENGRFHYHGYCDLIDVIDDELLPKPTRKYPQGHQLVTYTMMYGHNLLTPLKSSINDIKATTKYTLKYITKGDILEFKHEMFSSRLKQADKFRDLPF